MAPEATAASAPTVSAPETSSMARLRFQLRLMSPFWARFWRCLWTVAGEVSRKFWPISAMLGA